MSSHRIELTELEDWQLTAVGVPFRRLMLDEDEPQWLRRLAWRLLAVFEAELGARRAALHALDGELSGFMVQDGADGGLP